MPYNALGFDRTNLDFWLFSHILSMADRNI